MKKWPPLLGLTVNGSHVCVAVNGSTYSFWTDGNIRNVPARSIKPDVCRANVMILAEALMGVMNSKNEIEFDRGSPCFQLTSHGLEPWTLYLYEAGYSGAMFPRWKWTLPNYRGGGITEAAWIALCAEVRAGKTIVAKPDNRAAAIIK